MVRPWQILRGLAMLTVATMFATYIYNKDRNTLMEKRAFKHSQSDERIKFTISSGGNINYTDFWNYVRAQVYDDFLYPRTFDTDQVKMALRQAKLTHADVFDVSSSVKFKITLEGGQTAVFKIRNIQPTTIRQQTCNVGCEHPEYEVAAYILNRIFDLRNMPYTTGRVLSWYDDLEPVASPELRDFVKVKEDGSVCFSWECMRTPLREYCFPNGTMPGAVIYFVENKYIYHFKAHGKRSRYHEYYEHGARNISDLKRLPGDKEYCEEFRTKFPYEDDDWFIDIIDIAVFDFLLSHSDAKHVYVKDLQTDQVLFNLMFDFGRAFCRTPYLVPIAPLIQCCRIRTRLWKAMDSYKDSLEENFLALTEDDPLHPLLLPEHMEDLVKKFKQTLAFVEFCRALDGDSAVFMDL